MKNAFSRTSIGLYTILILGILALGFVAQVDYVWTSYLYDHRWRKATAFMRRSLFEGDSFGGSDFSIVLQVCAFFVYLYSWRTNIRRKWVQWRSASAFVLSSGLILGLGLVQNLKWLSGRARPNVVFRNELDYSAWYQFGPQFVTDGQFYGSFPSGHTASAVMLLCIAYLLAGDNQNTLRTRILGWSVGVIVLAYSSVMAVTSVMDLRHWLSDGLASIVIGWSLIHVIYFKLLNVPSQAEYWRCNGQLLPMPAHWELQLAGWLIATAFAASVCVLAVRSLWLGRHVAPILALLPALPLACFTYLRSWRIFQLSRQRFSRAQSVHHFDRDFLEGEARV